MGLPVCQRFGRAEAQGRGFAAQTRRARDLAYEYLNRHHGVSRGLSDLAFDVCEAAFNKVWHEQCVTWTVRERYEVLMKGFGKEIPEPDLSEVIRRHETMELDYRPDPARARWRHCAL